MGRRKDSRYGVANVDGRLIVARDVSVWGDVEHDMLVVSDVPETTGEVLTLERIVNGNQLTIEVSVIDSHPTLVNGKVRHRLRLRSNVSSQTGGRPVARAH